MFHSQKTVSMPVLEGSVVAREEVEVTANCCYDSESQNLELLWISREKLLMGVHLHPTSLNSSVEGVERQPAL